MKKMNYRGCVVNSDNDANIVFNAGETQDRSVSILLDARDAKRLVKELNLQLKNAGL